MRLLVMTVVALVVGALSLSAPAAAGCFPIASLPEGRVIQTNVAPEPLPAEATVRLTFLGHSSFLIETRAGASAVTDYNGLHRAPFAPNVVTMNNAHSTHFTEIIEPGVDHVLRGWGPLNSIADHDVEVKDLRVRNVPTSVHGRSGAQTNSNSMFVFEIEDLCIAHLGHLHHVLADYHLGELGIIDIVLAPIDGAYTMSQQAMADVIRQIRPSVVVPMHFFGSSQLNRFAELLAPDWTLASLDAASVSWSRQTLPNGRLVALQPTGGLGGGFRFDD
ncbi:MAG: MBL fold metallo-hydrolase [Geminicoccaceae bacterium]